VVSATPPPPPRPRYALWYGRAEPPAHRPVLRAGPVTAILDGADLRHVRAGDVELVERVYVAVRDAPWNTIPATFSDWVVETGADRFRVTFAASHRHEDIRFEWRGSISGAPDGTIRFEMDGLCRGVFQYSKIGFNVHHAQGSSVGRPYRARTEAGEVRGALPEAIDPQRIVGGTLSGMFDPYRELAIEVQPGLEAVVELEGDLLELQDHRNWTDSNFKSYATPLALGFPFDSRDGQRIRQVLTIAFRGEAPAASPEAAPEIVIGAPGGAPLPVIGLGMPSHDDPLGEREASLLRALRPGHVRVDVRAGDEGAHEALARAAADAERLGATLELAVHASEAHGAALAGLADRLRDAVVPVARVLVYPAAEGFSAFVSTTPPAIVALVRRHLEPVTGPVPFCGGTNQSFADVNRDRPTHPALSGVCFSISPTVHAADDWSIVENIASQEDVVRMARSFSGERPVCVSPVTIATRFGPYPAGPAQEGDLPPAVDARQASLLVAAWTVGSIAALAAGGASSATYYETTGWRGVIETDRGSPMPDRFPSRPGMVFPVYHVLADLAEWSAAEGCDVRASDPLRAVGLAARDASGWHLLVANVTAEAQRVLVRGLPGADAMARVLDEASAEVALDDPGAFRAQPGTPIPVRHGALWLELGPFAVARVDAPA
jgi:D-apionolactonase